MRAPLPQARECGVDARPAVSCRTSRRTPEEDAELGRERVHCASTISFSPAFPILSAGGRSEFELGFEKTRQTYASRAPSAAGGFRPDPKARPPCRNFT